MKNEASLAPELKFIARVGAGLETIDRAYAESKNIALLAGKGIH